MATLAQISRERKKVFRNLRSQMRTLDTAQEKAQRRIRQVVNRKRQIPEEKDLMEVSKMLNDVLANLNSLYKIIESGFPL